MLLEYMRDYLARGDAALMEYNDKPEQIRLAEEQRALMATSRYNNVIPETCQITSQDSEEIELASV